MFVAAIAGILASESILAPPVVAKVPLHQTKFEIAQLRTAGLRFFSISNGLGQLKGLEVPKNLGATHSALIYFSKEPIRAIAAKDSKENRFAKIWVDFNHNKKFESNELAVYRDKSNLLSDFDEYVFKTAPKGPGGPVYVKVIALKTQFAGLAPQRAMAGTLTIGGKSVSAYVVDTDFDGSYRAGTGPDGDIVICKTKDPFVNQSISQLLPMPDGRFYQCSIAKRGDLLTLTRDERPLGTVISTGVKIASLQLRTKKSTLTPSILNGQARVPAGDYYSINANVNKIGSDGKDYTVSLFGRPNPYLAVAANKTTNLGIGDDMKIYLTVTEQGKARSLDVSMSDKNGFRVSGLYITDSKSMTPPKEPQVTIYAPDGSTVLEKAFEYG